jgi:hypothetical protein
LLGKIIAPLQDRQKNPSWITEYEESLPQIEQGITGKGLNSTPMSEPIPQYSPRASDKAISHGNAWAILGKDSPSNKGSGYGGQGATGASAIDLVVGRGPLESGIAVDPNFSTDAARIHISQTTDVDKNFGLAEGSVGSPKGRSAIGIKADEVRIVGRHGIKIITEGRGSKLSKQKDPNEKQMSTVGIDLIAGNDSESLEPIPLGDTLVLCLDDLVDLLGDLSSIVSGNSTAIKELNNTFGKHTHTVPIGPLQIPTTSTMDGAIASQFIAQYLSIRAINPMDDHRTKNLPNFKKDNLKSVGDQYILSRYNNTN